MPRLATLLVLGSAACGRPEPPNEQANAPGASTSPAIQVRALTGRTFERTAARRARGEYLAEGILQCFVCHSERDWNAPGAPPIARRKGAGVVWRDEGTFRLVAPNLTPDADTGAGTWTDDMLARAIREGVGHDGRPLHPTMYYSSFRRLADEDLAAVIVYLRSLPPVRNALPKTVLSGEERERHGTLPRPITAPVPAPDPSDPVQRGRYLVTIADCEGCHTGWEAPRQPGLLAGGNLVERGERRAFSTNITPHASGVPYGADVFIAVMRSGRSNTLSPLMPWIALRNLTDDDLRAIHAFLQKTHPAAHFVSNTVAPTRCAVCGQEHGLGEANRVERPEAVAVDPRLYDAYAGTYRSDDYDFAITVIRDGDRLLAREGDGPPAELVPQSEVRFLLIGGVAPLRFVRDARGRATQLVSEEIEDIVLVRVE